VVKPKPLILNNTHLDLMNCCDGVRNLQYNGVTQKVK
jgi:hypothetical protein